MAQARGEAPTQPEQFAQDLHVQKRTLKNIVPITGGEMDASGNKAEKQDNNIDPCDKLNREQEEKYRNRQIWEAIKQYRNESHVCSKEERDKRNAEKQQVKELKFD